MPIFSNLMFQAVHWAARRGLREEESFPSDAKKLEARRTGIRGETYAYWYLRRQGYIFVTRNYIPRPPGCSRWAGEPDHDQGGLLCRSCVRSRSRGGG